MKRIMYVGVKDTKHDNVANTRLTWRRDQIIEIEDDAAATKLLAHPEIWVDADKTSPEQVAALRAQREGVSSAAIGVPNIVVVVSSENFAKISQGLAKLQVIDLTEGELQTETPAPTAVHPDFATMKRVEIADYLRKTLSLEVDARKFTDQEMVEFALAAVTQG